MITAVVSPHELDEFKMFFDRICSLDVPALEDELRAVTNALYSVIDMQDKRSEGDLRPKMEILEERISYLRKGAWCGNEHVC